MTDLRRHPRVQVECPVTVYTEDGRPAEGTAYDLSIGGCAIQCAVHLPPDSYLVLAIRLKEGVEPLSVELARVRWSMRQEFGAEFIILKRDERTKLERYLAGR